MNSGLNTPQRIVYTQWVKINAAADSSIVQFGDGEKNELKTFAIAVQRAIPDYLKDETRFASHQIFFLPDPQPEEPPGSKLIRTLPGAPIQIGSLEAVAIRASSVLRIGNTGDLAAQSRIHHIRHFNNIPSP